MTEKYLSGVLHPSEVMEMFRKLDISDKENFVDMLLEDEDVLEMLKTNLEMEDYFRCLIANEDD